MVKSKLQSVTICEDRSGYAKHTYFWLAYFNGKNFRGKKLSREETCGSADPWNLCILRVETFAGGRFLDISRE